MRKIDDKEDSLFKHDWFLMFFQVFKSCSDIIMFFIFEYLTLSRLLCQFLRFYRRWFTSGLNFSMKCSSQHSLKMLLFFSFVLSHFLYIYIYIYIYIIMKTMCPLGYYPNGFAQVHELPQSHCGDTGRAHCFHNTIYITLTLLL